MRKIRFRAIHKLTKHWFEESNIVFEDGKWFEDGRAHEDYRPMNLEQVAVMQYTGLKDNNGVDIYEGDIVEYHDTSIKSDVISLVSWSAPMFVVKSGLLYFKSKQADKVFDGKILGNIYENPELLGDGQ